MKNILLIVAALLLPVTASGQLKEFKTEFFHVEYEAEAEEYVMASIKVLELVRTQAIKLGFSFPEKLKFSILSSHRNVLYFDYKKAKSITWEYKSLSDFLPPSESHKNNIYGLCHEMGHICMFTTNVPKNNWMTREYREGWADFFGNLMLDSVYHYLGQDFWPEPHNYLNYAGMEHFLNRVQGVQSNPKLIKFNNAGLYWYELTEKIGIENMNSFFRDIKRAKVRNPDASEKYSLVLKSVISDDEVLNWFDWYKDCLILSN